MSMPNWSYSYEIERLSLACLLQYPTCYSDICINISNQDYWNDLNQTVFCVLRRTISRGEIPDRVLLAQEIKNLQIKVKDDVDVAGYIESLAMLPVNPKTVEKTFAELRKYSMIRELIECSQKIPETIRTNIEKPPQEIVKLVDSINNKTIDVFFKEENPIEIFDRLEEFILEKGRNPVEEMGLRTPHHLFNSFYGGLRNELYVWASRTSEGKSTYLMDLARKITQLNSNTKCLFLDTEMYSNDVMLRLTAAISGVPFFYLDTGRYMQNAEYKKKVTDAFKDLKSKQHNFSHKYVANKPIDEILSIARRWYLSKCSRGEQGVIFYDYLKVSGEQISSDNKEYQIMGEKANALRDLAGQISCPVLSAVQINRSGIINSKNSNEDLSIISISDRISWYCSYMGIFRRKTPEEITTEGRDQGSHKLLTLKARFQGIESSGHHDLVKVPIGADKYQYKINFINYDVKNFDVQERGCLRDMVKNQLNIANHHNNDGAL